MPIFPKYPIGMQSFAEIRRNGMLYVDKTAYVAELVSTAKYIFLGRPRRFGKSLLVSTLESYFKGRRELFSGLDIERFETEWTEYPVIHLDMSQAGGAESGDLEKNIDANLQWVAAEYGVDFSAIPGALTTRFGLLIKMLAQRLDRKVVVLIDEYDVAIHGLDSGTEVFRKNRIVLRELFQQCKSNDDSIRFCFVTGVARFNQFSLFSGPNNFKDISMDTRFAAICGFTHEELYRYFGEGIKELALENAAGEEEIRDRLSEYYDGYRFTAKDLKVFNPLSVLSAISDRSFEPYWIGTGLTSVFVRHLMNPGFQLPDITDKWLEPSSLTKIYDPADPVSLMFQTGYLTVADYDKELGMYRMRVPNREVMRSLTQDLIPAYMGKAPDAQNYRLSELRVALQRGDIERIRDILESIIAGIAYHLFPKDGEPMLQKEHYYHTIVYLIFMMLQSNVQCEMAGAKGRSDLVAVTGRYVYIFEFKMDSAKDGTPGNALRQIEEKGYAKRFRNTGKRIFSIGVVFSSERHDIAGWEVSESE